MSDNSNSFKSEPEKLKSHVHGLLDRVAASPASIAPERVVELKSLVERHRIEIQVKDSNETSFDMGAMYGLIFTPMRVYHHFWASALFFSALYIERERAFGEGRGEVSLEGEEIERVWGNYLLSCDCFKRNAEFPYPPDAAMITSRCDYISLADELFLAIAAFCILHEVAHLENGDGKTDDNGSPLNQEDPHEIEFAADKWAYDWILSKWDYSSGDPRVFIKRALGVIFSLALMDEFRHHQNNSSASSHPDSCDRMLRFFNDYKEKIEGNPLRDTCLTAAYSGLQVVAWSNKYLLPVEGFSDPISFVNLVKQEGPRLAAEAKARKEAYDAGEAETKGGRT